ncbi:hypothetical protein G3N59_01100 [Paraburkholderia sp. Ac-20340]|uniref:hypothetical protein n=1 Tax=Paraburkholderia sp. Ac-20340 TaxID=2703888 RepID=UPI0019813D9B|nr:hypothetical protein [Paraburkholderia sp. Ac-20340]MBN3851964.1 hypothetical protein [Paraburkholderia sp. Ac-20340]
MAKLLNAAGSVADVSATFEAMSTEELIATDLVQRGAIDALEKLMEFGVSLQTVDEMLTSARFGRQLLRSVAVDRGVRLVNEE